MRRVGSDSDFTNESDIDGQQEPQTQRNVIQSSEFLENQVYRSQDVYRSITVAAPGAHPAVQPAANQPAWGRAKQDEIQMNQQMGSLKVGFDAPPSAKPSSRVQQPFGGVKYSPPKSAINVETSMLIDDSANKEGDLSYLPACYGQNTSVISLANEDAILKGLDQALQGIKDVEHEVKRSKKVSGRYFWEDKMCAFMIHLFKTEKGCTMLPEEHRHKECILLEFQRREGDAFAFQRIYRKVVASLRTCQGGPLVHFSGNPNDEEDRTALPQELPALPMPAELTQALPILDAESTGTYLDFTQDKSLADNLVRMCRSIYLEPRREATCVLARGSRAEPNARLLAAVPQIIATLVKLFQDCMDFQVTRNCALILTNMFKHAADARETAMRCRAFNILGSHLEKWSGAAGDHQFKSKLVCCQIGECMEILCQGVPQSFIGDHSAAIKHLQHVQEKSAIHEAQQYATSVLKTIFQAAKPSDVTS